MKKLVLLLSFIILTTSVALASKYPKYDAELSKIRTVKNAQTSAINKEMQTIALQMEELETNTAISTREKNQKMTEYNAQLNKLSAKKQRISAKYNADKKELKRLYKH